MKIFRTRTFLKDVKRMGVTEKELKLVEHEIAADYTVGDVIQGTGGARKIRFAMGGKGKRGGGRAIYVAVVTEDTAYMLLAYPKSEQEDLTSDEKKAVKAFTDSL